jgi:hypothetical protein
MLKTAGDAVPTINLSGRLELSSSGWLLLQVPNSLAMGLFAALDEPGVSLPLKDGRLKAHISVMRPEEIATIPGGANAITERGKRFRFQLGAVKYVDPGTWEGVSRVWYVTATSPELRKLRASYGLTPQPKGDWDFHITFAIRKTNVLRNNETTKAAEELSLLAQEQPAPLDLLKQLWTPGYSLKAAKAKSLLKDLQDIVDEYQPSDPGYGYVWYNPSTGKVHGVVGDGDEVEAASEFHARLDRLAGCDNVTVESEYTPREYREHGSGWVCLRRNRKPKTAGVLDEELTPELVKQLYDSGHGSHVFSCGHKSRCRCPHGSDPRLVHTHETPCYRCSEEQKPKTAAIYTEKLLRLKARRQEDPRLLAEKKVTPAIKSKRVHEEEVTTCPHCQCEIGEKGYYTDEDGYEYHRGCVDKGPIGRLHGVDRGEFKMLWRSQNELHSESELSGSAAGAEAAADSGVDAAGPEAGESDHADCGRGPAACGEELADQSEQCCSGHAAEPHKQAGVAEDIAAAEKDCEEPASEEQARAGNYRHGHVRLHGLDVTLETAKGMTRRGTDKDGKPWSITMKHSYGYVRRTKSEADEDHFDVFLGEQHRKNLNIAYTILAITSVFIGVAVVLLKKNIAACLLTIFGTIMR